MFASWRQFFAGWNIQVDWPIRFLANRDTLFKRYLYRNYRTFASITHRFGRRVTPAGWMVLIGTVTAAALGADTNLSWSYQTFALLGCLVLAGALCTPLGRPGPPTGTNPAKIRIGRRPVALPDHRAKSRPKASERLETDRGIARPASDVRAICRNPRAGRGTAQLDRPHLRLLPVALAPVPEHRRPDPGTTRARSAARTANAPSRAINAVAPWRAAAHWHDRCVSRSLRVVSVVA